MFVSDINIASESQYLFYLIPVTIGVQLGGYFFYQYFKIKDVHLKLNRILLSFGLFTLLIILGALFLNVQRLFGGEGTDIFSRIGWACALSSPIGYLVFIIIEEFSSIMNLKFVKIITLLGLIPIITVLIFGVSPVFMGTLPFAVLSAYYIIGFQVKLIRRAKGNIKKRFLQFFIGELLAIAALPFAAMVGLGILAPGTLELIYYTGVSLLTIGFVTIFISAYDFPPFYEFEWKEELLKFFVINTEDNSCIYYCNLEELIKNTNTLSSLTTDGDKIFSGSIIGIDTIIRNITDAKSGQINTIQQEDSVILLDSGIYPSFITYALLVKRDLKSAHYFLKSIKKVFELLFRDILLKLETVGDNPNLIFRSFNNLLKDYLER